MTPGKLLAIGLVALAVPLALAWLGMSTGLPPASIVPVAGVSAWVFVRLWTYPDPRKTGKPRQITYEMGAKERREVRAANRAIGYSSDGSRKVGKPAAAKKHRR